VSLPAGVAAYLFTDLVGSTRFWEHHPDEMHEALARHDAIMREAFDRHGGEVFSIAGDSFGAAFATAQLAVTAAIEIQRELASEPWPSPVEIKPRMGIHVGPSTRRAGNFFGSDVNRAARLMAAAHGGQIVASHTVCTTVDDIETIDLGEHLLKDLSAPEHVYEIVTGLWDEPFPPLRTLDRSRVRLPFQTTALLGRDGDAAEITARFDAVRLLTIRGLGGVGKTRLSIHVAADLADEFPDGVHFVELARIADDDSVAYAVADAIGVRVPPGATPVDAVVHELGDQRRLVVLDNCEHVLAGTRRLVVELLGACGDLKVLATSRVALNVPGEAIFGLDPLGADSAESSAVELFLERARAVNARLEVDAARLETIAELCARLDGVPLAIELAAARCRSMTPEEMAEHLDDRFALLRARDAAVARHGSLLKTLEWSYEHLDDQAQLLLRRLSIFSGPATIASIRAVCGDDHLGQFDLVDSLESLVDNSLVIADVSEASTRYRVLETIREFGVSLLGDEGVVLRERHARHVADVVGAQAWATLGPDERGARRRLTELWDDLRSAVSFARLVGDVDLAAALVADLGFEVLWRQRVEASSWADSVRSMPGFADVAPSIQAGVLVTAACGKLSDSSAPVARELMAAIEALVDSIEPAAFTPGVLAATSVHFFLGDLGSGISGNAGLLARYGDGFPKFRKIALASSSSMYGYAGDHAAALESAERALAITDDDTAPTWQLLVEWGVSRFGGSPPDEQLRRLDGIIGGLLDVENGFIAAAARRYQLALGRERETSLRSMADELRRVDLTDVRYATGWMLTAATELLVVGDEASARAAIELLGWQDAHRVAPVRPELQQRLLVHLPIAEGHLGPDVVAALRERGAGLDLPSAVALAAEAAERAADLSTAATAPS
jgi:predicted ATPase/class 3 adenylate cyclase